MEYVMDLICIIILIESSDDCRPEFADHMPSRVKEHFTSGTRVEYLEL